MQLHMLECTSVPGQAIALFLNHLLNLKNRHLAISWFLPLVQPEPPDQAGGRGRVPSRWEKRSPTCVSPSQPNPLWSQPWWGRSIALACSFQVENLKKKDDCAIKFIPRAELWQLLLCLRAEKRQLWGKIRQFEDNFRCRPEIRIGLEICAFPFASLLNLQDWDWEDFEERGTGTFGEHLWPIQAQPFSTYMIMIWWDECSISGMWNPDWNWSRPWCWRRQAGAFHKMSTAPVFTTCTCNSTVFIIFHIF